MAVENDWAILERTDAGTFHTCLFVLQTTEDSLVIKRPYITIYHFPQAEEEAEVQQQPASMNRIIGAHNFELRCNNTTLISKISCGALYVDKASRAVIGFDIAGSASHEGKGDKSIDNANENVPIRLHFHSDSSLVQKLKRLRIII